VIGKLELNGEKTLNEHCVMKELLQSVKHELGRLAAGKGYA